MGEWRGRAGKWQEDHGWPHQPPDSSDGGGGGGWWRAGDVAAGGGGGGGGGAGKKAGRYGKPPRACSGQTVPRWERDFCTSEGSIPWKKLCETKKLMYLYENVAKWDDSEGKEAFQNAKARYWAKIHGLKCDIPLPNPDMYIDVVDQDTIIDPQLIEDLYKKPPPQNGSETESNCFLNLESLNQEVPATGWGDDEEDPLPTKNNENETGNFGYAPNLIEYEIIPSGWDDVEDSAPKNELKVSEKSWASTGDRLGEKWGNKSYSCNYYKRRNNNWNYHKGWKRMDYYCGQY
ncbi:uncharacterized protein LOC109720835 [Ananas comosus]|uniref:Uncharacterized protein LOC109720835 n=1 Tax=Ananas comosus TaxID=4615 RepID=A0A6P5G7H7_ANACO|nr:uncharacterized protein LOC109720835 [Ananas comosus]